MSDNNKNLNKDLTNTDLLVSLIISVLIYTAFGVVAGILYSTINNDLNLPHLSVTKFLTLWYMWVCLWLPPIATLGSMFNKHEIPNKK